MHGKQENVFISFILVLYSRYHREWSKSQNLQFYHTWCLYFGIAGEVSTWVEERKTRLVLPSRAVKATTRLARIGK